MQFLNLFVVFALICAVSAQVPFNGTCPDQCLNRDSISLNLNDYLGIWYLQSHTAMFLTADIKCSYLNITSVDNDTLIATKNYISLIDGQRKQIQNDIQILPNGRIRALAGDVHMPLEFDIVNSSSDYFVLISCNECGIWSKKGAGIYGYVYTKIHEPECPTKATALLDLSECGIPSDALIAMDQSKCQIC